jgi:hypothetical protein
MSAAAAARPVPQAAMSAAVLCRWERVTKLAKAPVQQPLLYAVDQEREDALLLFNHLKKHPKLQESACQGGDALVIKLWMLLEQASDQPRRELRLSAARRQDLIEMMQARGLEVQEKMTVIEMKEILKEKDASLRPPTRPTISGLGRMRKAELVELANGLQMDPSGTVDQLRLRLKKVPAHRIPPATPLATSSSNAASRASTSRATSARPICPACRRGMFWDEEQTTGTNGWVCIAVSCSQAVSFAHSEGAMYDLVETYDMSSEADQAMHA